MSASFSGFEIDRVVRTDENVNNGRVDDPVLARVDDQVPAGATDGATVAPLQTAARQAYVRSVNESLAYALPYLSSDDVRILCECGDRGCHRWITLSIEAYRTVRSEAPCYILAPGHEVPGLQDRVKQRHAAYTVVEARSA